ncbi:putative aryl-alcohol dehydrogenase AAD14 [Saccharomyces cerevisiae]|nr:putative aryl-alcohol dehydrogenase AAD14 [Saccharomyces cerevisiae]
MSELFKPAPEPATRLGRLRVLSKTAGIRVSPLILGGASLGDAWSAFMGSMNKEQAFELLDAFYEAGGNFVDTANSYQNEQSETWIGEWMKSRKLRDQIVISTKFTTDYKGYDFAYSSAAGKVLYLGVSDTPAWVVSAANYYATSHGKTPFSIYQGKWNVLNRDFERDIIPMARHFGMALAPWDVMGGGRFQSKKAMEERKKNGEGLRTFVGDPEQTDAEIKISEALTKVAEEHGTESVTAIAIAYVRSKAKNVFPLVGGRKIEHLKQNIEALSIKLTPEQIEYLESIIPFDVGFPTNFIGDDPAVAKKASLLTAMSAQISFD